MEKISGDQNSGKSQVIATLIYSWRSAKGDFFEKVSLEHWLHMSTACLFQKIDAPYAFIGKCMKTKRKHWDARIKTSGWWHKNWHCLEMIHFPSWVAHSHFDLIWDLVSSYLELACDQMRNLWCAMCSQSSWVVWDTVNCGRISRTFCS